MLPNDNRWKHTTASPICSKCKTIIANAIGQIDSAEGFHQDYTRSALDHHNSKHIGVLSDNLKGASIEDKLAISLIRELELEINDTIYDETGLSKSFKTTGKLPNVKWVQKNENFYLTSQDEETNDLETKFLINLQNDYQSKADEISEASKKLENESVKSVISKALEYNILQGDISDYSTSNYRKSINEIFTKYKSDLSTISQRSLAFAKLAGNKSLASLIESKTIKSNKKVNNLFSNDRVVYTTNLQESIKQTIIDYCKSNKVPNQLTKDDNYEQFMNEAEKSLNAEIKKIQSSQDWAELDLDWNDISGLPSTPKYTDLRDLRKISKHASDEKKQIRKVQQRAKELGLNLPKRKIKTVNQINTLFERAYQTELLEVRRQIEQEHGSLKDYQENLGLEELRDNLYRLNELPKLLRAGLPPKVAESFVEMRITESVVMMLGTAFGSEDGVMIPWEDHILDTLGLTPESHAWSDSHFMIDGVERQSKESINRMVEFIERTEDGNAFDYAIKHGGENFSLDDFNFLMRCVSEPMLEPLFINIELGIIDFATAKSAIIDYELDQIPDAHDAIQKIAEGEDLELTAAKYKQYQV